MIKTLKLILERHLQILEQEFERAKLRNTEAEYIYEDYKEVAEVTYRHAFGAKSIKALAEGCAEFLDMYGPFESGLKQLELFLKDTVTIEKYREWLRNKEIGEKIQ